MICGRSCCVSWLTREWLAEANYDKRDHELGFHSLYIRTYSIIHVITSILLQIWRFLYGILAFYFFYFMHSQLN
jgi:hypothetical protein